MVYKVVFDQNTGKMSHAREIKCRVPQRSNIGPQELFAEKRQKIPMPFCQYQSSYYIFIHITSIL